MIEIPSHIIQSSQSPYLIDFGGFQRPETGGQVTRINRGGNRYGLEVTFPPLRGDDGRIMVSRLIKGITEGIKLRWRHIDFDVGNAGNVTANGAGQSGRLLNVRGATPNYIFKEGQPFSIIQNGRHRFYFIDNDVQANGSGLAQIQISPMLRHETDNGAALHLSEPIFEGFIQDERQGWDYSIAHHTSISFTLEEF